MTGLGVALSTALAAQPIQVWQRTFDEAVQTDISVAQFRQVSPSRMAVLGVTTRCTTTPPYYEAHSSYWLFNNQGDTVSRRRFLTPDLSDNFIPLSGGDVLLTGSVDSAATPGSYNTGFFYVRADSLGNRRGRKLYLPTYRSAGGPSALLAVPGGGVLWAHTINQLAYVQGSFNGLLTAQVVRLDSAQRLVWQRQFPGNSPALDGLTVAAAALLRDGSYVLVGQKGRAWQTPYPPGAIVVRSGWAQRLKANGDTVRMASEYFGSISELYEPKDVQATSDGGYVVAGYVYPDKYLPVFNCCPNPRGFLAKFDSLGVQQWEQRLNGQTTQYPAAGLDHVQVLANGNYLVTGYRVRTSLADPDRGYLAAWAPGNAGTPPLWEVYFYAGQQQTALQPDGTLTLAGPREVFHPVGGVTFRDQAGELTRFAGLGAPYVSASCQRPPTANAGFVLNAARDTLRLLDFSLPGPRFATLERWRWHFPDGSYYDGPTPPPHRFATLPPAGAALTLTVTNNLGCSHTQTLYPFGAPTAAQQAKAFAAQASVFHNPAGGQTTLALAGLPPRAAATVQVRDALGRPQGPARALVVGADGTAALRLDLAGTAFALKLVLE
jgi:hypothetical protein